MKVSFPYLGFCGACVSSLPQDGVHISVIEGWILGEGGASDPLSAFPCFVAQKLRLQAVFARGSVNGGAQMVGPEGKCPHPILTSIFPLFTSSFDLILTPAQPPISNHGLETKVYRPLVRCFCIFFLRLFFSLLLMKYLSSSSLFFFAIFLCHLHFPAGMFLALSN